MKTSHSKAHYRELLIVIFLFITLITAACSNDNSDSNESVVLKGWVSVDDPIAGAKLTVHKVAGGNVDETLQEVTGHYGSFYASVSSLPADFRIVAIGGTYFDEASTAVFSVDARNYDKNSARIFYINAVTTMVSAYLDKHPEKTQDEATTIIKAFLELPEWLDIGSGLASRNEYFNHYSFMNEALANGGMNNYIAQLIDELDASTPGTTHPFPPFGPMLRSATTFIAKALAQGALSYVGGQAVGWALAEYGLAPEDANMAAMKNALNDIKVQLQNLSTQMSEMAYILSAQMTNMGYSIRVGQITELITHITNIQNELATYTEHPTDQYRDDILDEIKLFIKPNLLLIHNQLTGIAGQDGLLKLWNQVCFDKYRFLRAGVINPLIENQFNYFDMLQQTALLQAVEYYHKSYSSAEDYKSYIKPILNTYSTNRAIQRSQLKPQLPSDQPLIMDRSQNLMFYGGGSYTATAADGTEKQTIVPIKLTIRQSENLPADYLNYHQIGSFNNWRIPNFDELKSLFSACSSYQHNGRQTLAMQGWYDYLPAGMVIGSSSFTFEMPFFGGVYYYIRAINVDDCSEKLVRFYPSDRSKDPTLYWVPVRTMATGETSKYFYPR